MVKPAQTPERAPMARADGRCAEELKNQTPSQAKAAPTGKAMAAQA